ncbi:MAG: hypothetical protein HQ541_08560 [Mariniphaga sp.]|nr:hypothetical protein [Mariniphaga sp.]
MHHLQQKILNLSEKMDISKMGLRQIGKFIEEDHPQKVKHHIGQLEKRGLIYRNKKTGSMSTVKGGRVKGTALFSLPIVGSANCGAANILAQENIEGYLRVSSGLLEKNNTKGVFVIRAVGDSLNRAKQIEGGAIENGDYVIIDGENHNPDNGDYVLSIIDEMANLKRFYCDKTTEQITLISESSLEMPPIYIHPDDFSDYMINGKVVRVVKQPKQEVKK